MNGRSSLLPSTSTAEMFRVKRSLHSASFPRFRRFILLILLILSLFALYNGFIFPRSPSEVKVQADDRHLLARESDIVDRNAIAIALPSQISPPSPDFVSAVLVICATRPQAIKNHLEQLTRLRGIRSRFPIIVSQDGDVKSVEDTIKTFVNRSSMISHIQHKKDDPKSKLNKANKNYFFIAQHYKWALDMMFREMKYSHVIITEDDLDIAEDFFSYFSALKQLLNEDKSLWCISAWNDNGGKELTDRRDPSKLWRTDFFPGLGWMLTSEVWDELRTNWPSMYWDDWMRTPEVRKNRSCIRPEISRTSHNMRLAGKGSSGGLYKAYLSSITLPEKAVDFSLLYTQSLLKDRWDKQMALWLKEAKTVREIPEQPNPENSYKVIYSNAREWRNVADRFKLMNDIRSGMVRTGYLGVVPFTWKNTRIYAVPSWLNIDELETGKVEAAYDKKWDLQSKFMDFEKMYCKPTRFTGKCDPANPELRQWFQGRNMLKRLEMWGEMIVV